MTPATLKMRIASALLMGVFLNGGFLSSDAYGVAGWPGERDPTLIERWQADLIVFVEVAETQQIDGGQASRLKVITTIKPDGRNIADEVEVFIQLGSHWPYTFTSKTKAIAFLSYDEKQKQYVGDRDVTCGIDTDEATGRFYVQQSAKLPAILKEQDPRKLLDLKLEWSVEFALRPKTRYQAAYGINVLHDKAKEQKLLTPEEISSPLHWLSEPQKKRICQPFAKEVPNSNSLKLIRLMQKYPSSEIDGYLLKSLQLSLKSDTAVPFKHMRISELAFEYLPQRVGFKLPKTLQTSYEDYQTRRSDFSYHISIGDEYSDAERTNAKAALIKDWRSITTEFLKSPELQKIKMQ